MANLTDEQVAEFKVRRRSHSERRSWNACPEEKADGGGMVERERERQLLQSTPARWPVFDARPSPLLAPLASLSSTSPLVSLLLLVGETRDLDPLCAETCDSSLVMEWTALARGSLLDDRHQGHSPSMLSTHSLAPITSFFSNSTGGLCALRQGRRRDHHDQGAGHRHALAGPEPDGGGAAGESMR